MSDLNSLSGNEKERLELRRELSVRLGSLAKAMSKSLVFVQDGLSVAALITSLTSQG